MEETRKSLEYMELFVCVLRGEGQDLGGRRIPWVLTYVPGFLCGMVDCGEEEDVVVVRVGRVGRVEGLEILEEGLSGTALLRGVAGTAQLGCACEGE